MTRYDVLDDVLVRGWTTRRYDDPASAAWLVLDPLRDRQQNARLWINSDGHGESATVQLDEPGLRELARRLLHRADALDRARLWPRCTCPGVIAPDTSRVAPSCPEHSSGYGRPVQPLALTAGSAS